MAKKQVEAIEITPPRFNIIKVTIDGASPYMQARFSAKAMQKMKENMEAGPDAKKKRERKPRDFEDDFQQAIHFSEEGWIGIPAPAFRNACIDVCRMVNFKMNYAKMSLFCEADGFDRVDGQPLVKLIAGDPEKTELSVRNDGGSTDIRVRPLWRKWSAVVRLRFDADQFKPSDVINLLARAGLQVGIGEGRPYSKKSNGLGYGTFVIRDGEAKHAA